MTPAQPLIVLRNVYRIYGGGSGAVRALDGIDLDVHRGEFVALMGPSGSGKSTTLNTLGCLDVPTSGTYHFHGIEVTHLDKRKRALVRRNWFGFVFQSFNLLSRSSALENVELPLIYRGLPARERLVRARQALAEVGLADRAHHHPNALSGGEQQRVAIARALVTDPDVVLADEPTGNLDTKMSHEVMQLLARLNEERGQTIIMVSHEPEMARYTTRIVHFRDGRIEASTPVARARTA